MAKDQPKAKLPTLPSNAQTTNGLSKPQVYHFGSDEAEKTVAAIRSQVLQKVNDKNNDTMKTLVKKFQDEQQIEIEKIKRHCEQTFYNKMKSEIYSQVMSQIKKGSKLDWNDEMQKAIQTNVAEKVDLTLESKMKQAILTERKMQESTIQKSVSGQVKGMINGNIQQAILAERKRQENALGRMEKNCKDSNKRIEIVESKGKDSDQAIIEALSIMRELTNQGVNDFQATTTKKLARLEHEVIDRLDETQEALSIQIDTLTTLWTEMSKMRTEAQERSTTGSSNYLDEENSILDDLISFDDTLPTESESLLAGYCRTEPEFCLLDSPSTDPMESLNLLEQDLGPLKESLSTMDVQVGKQGQEGDVTACLALYTVDTAGVCTRRFLAHSKTDG